MPQRLLLEGPDLEALLLRARSEYGPQVTVVRAEKVRTGGVLGFFAREHFELTLEVPDAALAAVAEAKSVEEAPAQDVDPDFAAEIADAQAAREAMLGLAPSAPHSPAPAAPAVPSTPSAPEAAAQPSTETEGTFASFSRALQESAAAQAAAARAELIAEALGESADEVRPAPAPTPQPEATRPEATQDVLAAEAAPAIDHPRSQPESTDMAEFDRLVLQLTESAASQRVQSRTVTKAEFPVAQRTGPSGAGGVGGGAPGQEEPSSGRERPDAGAVQDAGLVLHKWGVFTDVAHAVSTKCTVPALLALGVPRRFTRAFEDLNKPVPLLDVIAGFGVPPMRRPEPGDLLVIVGPAAEALAVSRQVAAWMGMPATSVVLAGEIDAIRGHGRRIRTEQEAKAARRRADKVAKLGEPLIVALGIGPGRRGAAAAAPMVAAFEADTTWAVVDATKRAAVTEPGVKLLAEQARVDAIAAVGLADAQAPAAILDASLPIAWMDGLPAASVVWAALLGERIADAE